MVFPAAWETLAELPGLTKKSCEQGPATGATGIIRQRRKGRIAKRKNKLFVEHITGIVIKAGAIYIVYIYRKAEVFSQTPVSGNFSDPYYQRFQIENLKK